MNIKNAIKQSCDIYFYETSRLLGVDRLNETARKFGLGDIVLKDMDLISKNLQPKHCKRAEHKTVGLLMSKPVAIN